jgi:hypothetical protein
MESAPPPRRIKSYSAATGYVYQYHFHQVQPVRRGLSFGNEYTYLVSADRKTTFPLRILVLRGAMERWSRLNGRPLTGTEEYAAAKMRLFQAFDQTASLSANQTELVVDDSNLAELLAQLDII